jgi:hypothetical protein
MLDKMQRKQAQQVKGEDSGRSKTLVEVTLSIFDLKIALHVAPCITPTSTITKQYKVL